MKRRPKTFLKSFIISFMFIYIAYFSAMTVQADKGEFYDKIGIGAHPAIKATQGNIPSVITFQNVLVDTNTIKILFYLLPSSKSFLAIFQSVSVEFFTL